LWDEESHDLLNQSRRSATEVGRSAVIEAGTILSSIDTDHQDKPNKLENKTQQDLRSLWRTQINPAEVELNRSAVVDDWESLLFQVVAAVLDVLVG
jgi:hypothetical protein